MYLLKICFAVELVILVGRLDAWCIIVRVLCVNGAN